MSGDRDILVAALEKATIAFQNASPMASLLAQPDRSVLDPLAAAIDQCAAYEAVAGQVLFAGGSGPVIESGSLSSLLFTRSSWHGGSVVGAVDWLLKMLGTREATVVLKSAIWGLEVKETVLLGKAAQLIPFRDLPDSYLQGRITDRARTCYEGSVWISPTYYDLPGAAYVEEATNFPYIRQDGAAFQKMSELENRLDDLVILLQATAVGQPIVVASWIEYQDRDLEYCETENAFTWHLPEVHPRVSRGLAIEVGRFQESIANFDELTNDRRDNLLRSMDRFRLSQCRRQSIDRVLDLTLAFEIAVSGGGEQSPPNYKVSVRTAQTIGGSLTARQRYRAFVSKLYTLRNQATHGGQLKGKSEDSLNEIIDNCIIIYMNLINRLLSMNRAPDWQDIELEGIK